MVPLLLLLTHLCRTKGTDEFAVVKTVPSLGPRQDGSDDDDDAASFRRRPSWNVHRWAAVPTPSRGPISAARPSLPPPSVMSPPPLIPRHPSQTFPQRAKGGPPSYGGRQGGDRGEIKRTNHAGASRTGGNRQVK